MPGLLPVEADDPSIAGVAALEPPPQRQCGRCRRSFPAEAGLDPRSLREWWACPPCRAALFPPKAGAGAGVNTARSITGGNHVEV